MNFMKNRKKLIIIISIIAAVAVLLLLFVPRKAKLFYGSNVENIQSIYIMSGSTGETVYLEEEDYEYVLEYLDEMWLVPDYFTRRGGGWWYEISIETEDKVVCLVFRGDLCDIDNFPFVIKGKTSEEVKDMVYELTGW